MSWIEELTQISFYSINSYMIEGHGFQLFETKNKGKTRIFARGNPNKHSSIMMIEILSSKKPTHYLNIYLGSDYNISNLKTDILSNGYKFNGWNKYDYLVYNKGSATFLISRKPSEKGITQIMYNR
ncbi:hypothetical protein ABMY20_09425 [Tenacibaculum sp. SSH1-16]|uniref:hypothetical protein n=1 Tax=Tenacibaculum sp. SSH1-16 TaxID=3136667 RepID=UPI0032C470E8